MMIPLDLADSLSMGTLYMASAVGGGTLLLLQTFLLLLGVGDGAADVDAGADLDVGDGSFHLLSVRAIMSFFTFFGLVGWWGTTAGWGELETLGLAVGSGLAIMIVVAWLVGMQSRLQSKGNLVPSLAVGTVARVYLRIPAENAGQGKITVSIQGQSAEFEAFTTGPEIPTGAEVRVVRMSGARSFEVANLTEETA